MKKVKGITKSMGNQGGSEITDYCSMGRGGYTDDKDGSKIRFHSQEFISQKCLKLFKFLSIIKR